MTRDWEVIRAILTILEAASTADTVLDAKNIPGRDEQHVAYNMRLLKENGLIDAMIMESLRGDGQIFASAQRLTSAGHDFLGAMRSDTLWGKMRDHFKNKGVPMTVDLVIAASKKFAEALAL